MESNITPIAPTMTPDEFAARFAPATPADYFIRSAAPADEQPSQLRPANPAELQGLAESCGFYLVNRETGKLELHFDKAAYDALDTAQKQSIRSNFLWGRNSGCWISRAKEPNLWHAERTAKALGLADAGSTGERLSFAEQQQRKAERAERRADRYEDRAIDAEANAKRLQKPIEDRRGDIAFFTQPNINTSSGRAFARRREKMFAAFDRGTEEYRKSEHYRERAEIARRSADQVQLRDKGFIDRRIRECESAIRKLRKSIEEWETVALPKAQAGTLKRYNGEPITVQDVEKQLETWLDRLEAQLDKLGYYQEALETLGGVAFSKENIKPGFVVKVKTFGACRVISTGPKNFTGATQHGSALTFSYAEITELVSSEADENRSHPFKLGESFTMRNGVTHTITKVTAKTVTLKPENGDAYRVTPKYRPIPASGKMQWTLVVGSGCWASEIIYRD